ncbi:MAG: ATP-dependent DNA helicase RecG [Clostridiales bacterium]|nr:ATP-dependent DNA helicase RecG [Clostridiales bacterium]
MNIEELKGLGPKKAESFANKEIYTAEDLVRTLPVDYEDRRHVTPMAEVLVGQPALVRGKVIGIRQGGSWKRNRVLLVTLQDTSSGKEGPGAVELVFFNAVYLSRAFKTGAEYYCYGRPSLGNGKIQMIHPEFTRAEEAPELALLPVYPVIRGVGQRDMRRFVRQILDSSYFRRTIAEEYIPAWYLEKYQLPGIGEALWNVHFPEDFGDVRRAKKRILYEDMLLLHLGLLMMKGPDAEGRAFPDGDIEEYISALPFPLTNAQRRTVLQVEADMQSSRPMNRLIQGDVGSGKTAVAEIALFKVVKNGCQGAFMMPTEILARQQYEGLKERFAPFGIRVGLLIGSMSAREKNEMLEQMADGTVDVIVGTHALIQPGVRFASLGLVITDEQHRFGVRQRSLIKEKGTEPDCLVMSATPIPRTLAMILFGDMDISAIDELPAGRKAIKTKAVTGKSRGKVYRFVEEEVEKGRQAYVVCPLIEDSESMDGVRSAVSVFEELEKRFRGRHVALLHGEMSPAEKAAVMQAFSAGQIDILVSTVVIEVGINVPNATVMVIENSERFGLSQLHQLRGRVGRGAEQSYCILITEDLGETALARAKIMTESNDGFYIAEKDLELRGPGELFGDRQHGVPSAHIFNLINNPSIFEQVREDAARVYAEHPDLLDEESQGMARQVARIFGRDIRPTL